jgi:hypothetical protein
VRVWIIAFSFQISVVLSAYSAEFIVHSTDPVAVGDRGVICQIELAGEITPGDAQKISKFMDEHEGLLSGTPFFSQVGDGYDLCLNSPGGSYAEALRIVDEISDRKIGTRIASNAECASACAIVFLGGTLFIDGDFVFRVLEPPGRLGVHAPSIELPGTAEIPSAMVKVAYEAALSDIAGVVNRLAVQSKWGREARMHPGLLKEMMSTPPQSMFYVTTLNEIVLWGIDLPIVPNDSVNLSDANLIQACENQTSWIDGLAANSASKLEELGDLIHVNRIQDRRANTNEVAVQIELGGFYHRFCTFFFPRGLDRIRNRDVRVIAQSEQSGREETKVLHVMHFLDPEQTLEQLQVRFSK